MTIMDAKRNYVVDVAIEMLLEQPISAVTIKDIAKACGVGEATIYRYFSTKCELVVACALKLQAKTEKIFADYNAGNLVGYEALVMFYRTFLEIFEKHTFYLSLLFACIIRPPAYGLQPGL